MAMSLRSKPHLGLLLAGALFLAGAVYNLTRHAWANLAAGLVLGGVLVALGVRVWMDDRANRVLVQWLLAHRDELARGGAVLDGVKIGPETTLRQYGLCVSMLVISVRSGGRLLVEGRDAHRGRAAWTTVVTLLLGWWGIPDGPLWTLAVLRTNLRGGERTTVGGLLRGVR